MVMILVLQGMKLSREGVESKNFLMYVVVVVVEGVAKKIHAAIVVLQFTKWLLLLLACHSFSKLP